MNSKEPVAWAVVYVDEIDSVYDTKEDCERFMETQCRRDYMTAVPLYRNPDGEQEYGSLRAENERLRAAIRLLADQDATLSVCGGAATVTMDATLTDAEREAIMAATGWLMWCDKNGQVGDPGRKDIETLVALLDRTK